MDENVGIVPTLFTPENLWLETAKVVEFLNLETVFAEIEQLQYIKKDIKELFHRQD